MDVIPSLYTLHDPDVRADPHPFYRQLRETGPVLRDPISGHWLVTGYAEAMSALLDRRLSAQRIPLTDTLPPAHVAAIEPLINLSAAQMLFLDPPDHGRLRGVVAKAFTPKRAQDMRHRIVEIVNDLVAPLDQGEDIDVINDLAYPLPAIVIAEMLGTPAEDRAQFKIWCDDFIRFIGTTALSETEFRRVAASASAMMDYFRDLVEARRLSPRDDVLSDLVKAQDQGRVAGDHEFLANCVLLLTAGHETSTHMLGNAMVALLQHADQREHLRRNLQGMPNALSELLRYDGPVQFIARTANDNMQLGDGLIDAGDRVLLLLAAANRDPRTFPHPDTLDLTRSGARALAFGHGIHVCLGAPLARLEGEVALEILLRRFPNLHATSAHREWLPVITFRGLQELWVHK